MTIIIRKLKEQDLFDGFLTSLDTLSKTSNINAIQAKNIFEKINSNPNHIIFVALSHNRVVGSVSLLIELKFIHDGGLVGHLEDLVVDKKIQSQGIGKKLVMKALDYTRDMGCYKTILDCHVHLSPFYEKFGFKTYSNAMRFDH